MMPTVSIAHRYPGVDIDCVSIDNQAGIELLVRHLEKLGHRKIGFFGRCRDVHWATVRFGAYVAALTNMGAEYRPGWVVDVDFDTLTRSRTWFVYASTWQILRELSRPDSTRVASMAVAFHMRLTRPILGLLLVFMGLSVILRDQNRNIFISTALCLVLCAIFFGSCFACKYLGDNEYLSPALAAWMPVLGFGPLAFVLFDAIHT